jgi:superfamily I DNA and RNA helicase
MEFYPNVPYDKYHGQHIVWEAIKDAFRNDEGLAFYRYPIRALHNDVDYEPDTLLALRDSGIWVLECKGLHIEHLLEVQGAVWYTRNFYRDEVAPLHQADDQMYAVQGRVNQVACLREAMRYHARAVLPFITRAEWDAAGLPPQPRVIFKDDLKPQRLRQLVAEANERRPQPNLTDEQWTELRGVFGAKVVRVTNVTVARDAAEDHPRRAIKAAHERMTVLDRTQLAAALVTPPGPQRLRGLAGSGKTVILAKRLAHLPARHPDWDLCFVFFTKSLADGVRGRIVREYQEITGSTAEPDWDRVRIWHAWGGASQQGFYHHLCQTSGSPFERFDFAKTSFTDACDRLETRLHASGSSLPPLFDAIFIDEGQDLPHSFYRLALQALRDPMRLTWAFDEAQSIDQLSAPEAAVVFGRSEDGQPVVDLRGTYEGGAQKSLTMRRSYRTPTQALMAAHAVNMGLFRVGGAIQGLTNQEDWRAIGYEVLEGDFTRFGQRVRLHRPDAVGAHPYDADADLLERARQVSPILAVHGFDTPEVERAFLVERLRGDLERGFHPEDLMVVALDDGYGSKRYLTALADELHASGVHAHVVSDGWTKPSSIPLAHVYRAKGNEASRVYACRFEFAHEHIREKTEVHARNSALVAMTRARLWVNVSSGGDAPVLREIETAIGQYPNLEFESFTQRSLERVVEIAQDEGLFA